MLSPCTFSSWWLLVALAAPVFAQSSAPKADATEAKPDANQMWFTGIITSDDVYVRSGPSRNYYPMVKLKKGEQVQVFDREGQWFAIAPPRGCFSLMAKEYVDTRDGRNGVVNGNSVRIRAGSELSTQIYKVQTKLNRGDTVRIIGNHNEDYYRITPPEGAKLWVFANFVERQVEPAKPAPAAPVTNQPASVDAADQKPVDTAQRTLLPPRHGESPMDLLDQAASETSTPSLAPESPTAVEVEDQPAVPPDQTSAGESSEPSTPTPPEPGPDPKVAEFLDQIKQLDAKLLAELNKPVTQRELAPILEGFRPLAEQQLDGYTRLYAETRIAQIEGLMAMAQTVDQIRQLGDQVKSDRQAFLTARTSIHPAPGELGRGYDVEGQLLISAVFANSFAPQRYRLIEPERSPIRTLGYVEIPGDSGLVPTDYVGHRVGVWARQIKMEGGNVDPVPVYVAAKIVILDQPTEPTERETDTPK